MADNKTNYLENKILDHVLRGNVPGTVFPQPASIWIGLFTSDPGDEGDTSGEVSTDGTGYARRQVTFNAASNGSTSNSNNVVFPKSTAPWGVLTHFALFDAEVGGNMLFYGPLSEPIAVDAANRRVEFEVGAITITEH